MPDHPPPPRLQSIDGVALPYLAYDGGPKTIVLLHATGFLPWLWHPIARHLAPQYRVIAPYFCTHRRIDPQSEALDWMELAKDLAVLCRAIGIDSPILVGHSMGGALAALAHTAHGLETSGMVLIEPIFLPPSAYLSGQPPVTRFLANKAMNRRSRWADAEELTAYMHTKSLFANWTAECVDLYVSHGTVTGDEGLELACPPLNEAALFNGGTIHDPWPLLARVNCPALIIEGANSDLKDILDLTSAATRLPHGRYDCIGGAGHLIPMEKPDTILSMVREFARGICKG